MIQDYDTQVATSLDLTGAAPGSGPYALSPWVVSPKAIQIGTLYNALTDIGAGQKLCMEFEVTEAFTGYVGAAQIPHLMMGVCIAEDAALATNMSMLGLLGWTFSTLKVEMGLQPSDSLQKPALFKNDRYYVHIPPGVFGLPWIGTGATQNRAKVPGNLWLGAFFGLPMRTGTAAALLNTGLWTQTNFTAGKISARVVIDHPQSGGVHTYKAGMTVA